MPADGGSSQGWQVLLPVVSAVAAVLSALAAIWFPLIAGPRYRLLYGPMPKWQLPDGPWQVRVYLSSRGRRDITRDAFDDGEPVALDLGVPIHLKEVSSSRRVLRTVAHRAEGTCLLIGPGLIGRRQDLCFTVIADSEPKPLTCQASLIDVRVRRQFVSPAKRFDLFIGIALAAFTLFSGLALVLLTRHGVVINELTWYAIVVTGFIAIFMWGYIRHGRN